MYASRAGTQGTESARGFGTWNSSLEEPPGRSASAFRSRVAGRIRRQFVSLCHESVYQHGANFFPGPSDPMGGERGCVSSFTGESGCRVLVGCESPTKLFLHISSGDHPKLCRFTCAGVRAGGVL